jgi:hypothetical protein
MQADSVQSPKVLNTPEKPELYDPTGTLPSSPDRRHRGGPRLSVALRELPRRPHPPTRERSVVALHSATAAFALGNERPDTADRSAATFQEPSTKAREGNSTRSSATCSRFVEGLVVVAQGGRRVVRTIARPWWARTCTLQSGDRGPHRPFNSTCRRRWAPFIGSSPRRFPALSAGTLSRILCRPSLGRPWHNLVQTLDR